MHSFSNELLTSELGVALIVVVAMVLFIIAPFFFVFLKALSYELVNRANGKKK